MIKKEIKLTKNQIEPFKEVAYLKASIAEMLILVGKKQEELWERLQQELNIEKVGENLKINHKTKTLIYYIDD